MENLQHFIAGWGAGTFGVLVGYPMDTIKTHQQMSNHKLTAKEATKHILMKDGVQGLYKGMLIPLLGSGSLNSIYFGMYSVFLKYFQSLRGHDKILPSNSGWVQDLFLAGSIGGLVQALITCPSELVKIRMQLGKGAQRENHRNNFLKKMTTFATVLEIYKKFGFPIFFAGLVPTLLRDGVGGGVYILSYQYTRHYMYGELNPNPGLLETVVAGGVAGIASWIPVIPFDTIKSRMQADDFQNRMYKGMLDASIDLYRNSSYYGFYKGFVMITVRSIPVNISIIYGYELILWFCERFQ